MTVFVASLFLPFTIHFDVEQQHPSPPESLPALTRTGSIDEPVEPSLFNDSRPATAISAETSAVQDPVVNDGFFLALHGAKAIKGTPTAASSLNMPMPLMTPNEPHSPAWGRTSASYFQPKSKAQSPPPISILDRARSTRRRSFKTSSRRTSGDSRDDSHERLLKTAEWSVQPSERGNGGLFNAVYSACETGSLKEKTWVGTLGMPIDALPEDRREDIAGKLESEFDCLTVFPADSDFDGHYSHFCKTILWPVFHYQIPDNPKSKAYQDHSWIYYVKINQLFADRIVSNWKRGDVIWVHDYHLLLVPGMIRKKLPEAQIGIYLHVAFPSSEVFRCLAVRTELLDGMLGANLIGFQTEEYIHHFLQTCNRLLNVEVMKTGIQLEERFVDVGTFPIGIDPGSIQRRREDPEVLEWLQKIEAKYAGKHLIVARDKLDHVRGVRQKLLSYELFLNSHPEFRENTVLIQVATSTTEQAELDATVSDIVTRINSQHSTLAHQPLVFLKQDMEYAQFVAMITAADVLMITSLREGMNLTSHEYVFCQDGKYGTKKHGALILSEFTGSAAVLSKSQISVNPWNYRECAEAINTALTMGTTEKEQRWTGLYGSVMHHTAEHWLNTYLDHLKSAWELHSRQHTVAIPRLSVAEVAEKYKRAKHRLFMLDYEGTLAAIETPTSIPFQTPQRTIEALTEITYDPRNVVYVMSNKKPEDLDNLFRRLPNLGLIAENGCFMKEIGEESWFEAADMEKMTAWKLSVSKILEYYQERTEGSWVEERYCSLVYHWGEAKDAVGAARLAGDCATHINDACQNLGVHAVPFEGGLLIESTEWNKGTAATRIFDNLRRKMAKSAAAKGAEGADGEPAPEFLFAAGNAREDECVYRWANKLGTDGIVRDVTTVSVSSRNTEAQTSLKQGVSGILSALRKFAALD